MTDLWFLRTTKSETFSLYMPSTILRGPAKTYRIAPKMQKFKLLGAQIQKHVLPPRRACGDKTPNFCDSFAREIERLIWTGPYVMYAFCIGRSSCHVDNQLFRNISCYQKHCLSQGVCYFCGEIFDCTIVVFFFNFTFFLVFTPLVP